MTRQLQIIAWVVVSLICSVHAMASIYYPHVHSGDGWETEIGIINTSETATVSGTLNAMDNKGQLVTGMDISIPPKGRKVIRVGKEISSHEIVRYMILNTTATQVTGYTKFSVAGKYRAALPAISQVPSGNLAVAHVASDDQWWTGIGVVNTEATSKEIRIAFDTGTEIRRTIDGGAHDAFTIRELFGGTAQPDLQSAVIINSAGIIGLELFGSTETSTRRYLSGIILSDTPISQLYYPHVISNSDWWTGIVAFAPDNAQWTLSLYPYTADGTLLQTQTIPMSEAKYVGTASMLQLPANTAWFRVSTSAPVVGLELFGRQDGNQLGGYTTGANIANNGVFPCIDPEGWTGIAFVNTENKATQVNLDAMDDNGVLVATAFHQLNPYEKRVDLAQNFFSSSISTADYIRYTATAAIAGFQLNGSSDGTLLDSLPVFAYQNQSQNTEADWTYMVYIAGDNNLSPDGFDDINEMEQVGSTDKVNIVVQAEFSQQYSNNLTNYNTQRGKIVYDTDNDRIQSSLTDIGNQDMGNKQTLTDFIQWAAANYPAQRYALVLWDHGDGWRDIRSNGLIRGALQDETSGSFMSLPDIATAIRDAGVHFDVIDFDACLMAMYEVVYEFAGLVDYMVFSEEVEPGEGNPYMKILNPLTQNPNMSSEQFAKLIPDVYKQFYQSQARSSVTKSAVNMSYTAQLHSQMRSLAQAMTANMETERPNIQQARDGAVAYEAPENHDLGDFIQNLSQRTQNNDVTDAITDLQNTLSSMIIANEVFGQGNEIITRSTGLAVFIPRRSQVSDADLTEYGRLAVNQTRSETSDSWGGFVNLLVTGDVDSGGNPEVPLETGTGNFVVKLTWDTDADLDLLIWEADESWAAPYIGATSANGFLSEDSMYSGESVEYYSAAATVAQGIYDIFVNYYEDGPTSSGANASVYVMDPENGDTQFRLIAKRYMDLSHPAPLDWDQSETEQDNVANEVYSDWWWPSYVERSRDRDTVRIGNKRLHFRAIPFKGRMKKPPQLTGDIKNRHP